MENIYLGGEKYNMMQHVPNFHILISLSRALTRQFYITLQEIAPTANHNNSDITSFLKVNRKNDGHFDNLGWFEQQGPCHAVVLLPAVSQGQYHHRDGCQILDWRDDCTYSSRTFLSSTQTHFQKVYDKIATEALSFKWLY